MQGAYSNMLDVVRIIMLGSLSEAGEPGGILAGRLSTISTACSTATFCNYNRNQNYYRAGYTGGKMEDRKWKTEYIQALEDKH